VKKKGAATRKYDRRADAPSAGNREPGAPFGAPWRIWRQEVNPPPS